MILATKVLVEKAIENKLALGAFNAVNLETTRAIANAAHEKEASLIIQFSQKAVQYAGVKELIALAQILGEKSIGKISLHLDHGTEIDLVKEAVNSGFSSVMFDGSKIPFEQNVRLTKEIVDLAHPHGILVEGELGRIKGVEDQIINAEENLTDPDQAEEFVHLTGVDLLAVAFGNAHGMPTKKENLNFDLLRVIKKKTKIPLVAHGSSSTPGKDLKKMIESGVIKINFDTDLRWAFTHRIRDYLTEYPQEIDPRQYLSAAEKAMGKVVEDKIMMLGVF
jgi:fructose-bisphosphate aldolase class II